jgi:hypothetical protein
MKQVKKPDPRSVSAKKDLKAVLSNFFERNIPQLGGVITREPVVDAIIGIFDKFCPPTDRMKAGQVLWYAVDVEETAGYGKRLEDCRMVPVTLDLFNRDDARRIEEKMPRRDRSLHTAARLFKQGYKQAGVLTLSDAASVMRVTPSTMSKYVRDYERLFNVILPRRGTIHDMGPTLTHKRVICFKHMVEGKTVEQTARETRHSVSAVTRYANDYRRVLTCQQEGWDVTRICAATGLSKSLVKEYLDLIEEHMQSSS